MTINLPYKVRAALYIITLVGTPLVAVLVDQAIIPAWVSLLWSAEVVAVSSLAAFNVTKNN